MTNMRSVRAPAKIILFGEHAVVYGYPAIAAPVKSLYIEAVWQPATTLKIITTTANGEQMVSVPDIQTDDPISRVVRLTSKHLNIGVPLVHIDIHSHIPIASGLGSGAALSAVLARVLAQAADQELSPDALNHIVFECEKLHHGTPSGIDNTVIVFERTIYFVKNEGVWPIAIKTPLHIVIADTGVSAPTRAAVSDVRVLYDQDRVRITAVLEEIGELTGSALKAMQKGDITEVARMMNRNHTLLQELTVSSPELDRFVDAARNAGALGAKLSGGGRGGNMIALVAEDTAERVRSALRQAGAVRVFSTEIL